jgi:hypothetical protein
MVGCELGERHNAVDLCMFGMFTKESVGYRSSQVFWRDWKAAKPLNTEMANHCRRIGVHHEEEGPNISTKKNSQQVCPSSPVHSYLC